MARARKPDRRRPLADPGRRRYARAALDRREAAQRRTAMADEATRERALAALAQLREVLGDV